MRCLSPFCHMPPSPGVGHFLVTSEELGPKSWWPQSAESSLALAPGGEPRRSSARGKATALPDPHFPRPTLWAQTGSSPLTPAAVCIPFGPLPYPATGLQALAPRPAVVWTPASFWVTFLSEEREGHSGNLPPEDVTSPKAPGPAPATQGREMAWGVGPSSPGAAKPVLRAPSSVPQADGAECQESGPGSVKAAYSTAVVS